MKSVLLFLLLVVGISAQQTTVNYDNNRTNATSIETQLTPSNVATNKFGLKCTASVDDRIFAQPLYVPSVIVSGTPHDLLIAITMHDSLYAFDANTCTVVWSNVSFDTAYGSYPLQEGGLYGNLGCLSTPVVDIKNSKIYAVCDSATGPTWIARAFSLTTGTVLYSSSLTGQVVGTGDTGISGGDGFGPITGDTTSGSNLLFFPRFAFQRAGLALSPDGSYLYIGFGGLDDTRPYHGWLMVRNTSDLSAVSIWCSTPNSWGGAIWMAGGGPSIDISGNVYVTTGNGYKTGDAGAIANALVKFSPTLSTVTTWFPSDEANDDTVDADVASDRFLLIPGTNYGVVVSKDFYIYLINLTTMTLAQTAFQGCVGCTAGPSTGSFGMAFFNNTLFVPITTGTIYAFTWNPGSSLFTTTPLWTQSNSYGSPGAAQISGSCNGTSNCILWVVTAASSSHTAAQAGTLRAIDPTTGTELWNSSSTLSNMTKFAAPLIVAGNVYVATQSNVVRKYGLISSGSMSGIISGTIK